MLLKPHLQRFRPWLFAVTAALLLQSLFPNGYMPGSWQQGWLATLCPEGMPAGFMQQLRATDLGQHQPSAQSHDLHPAGHHSSVPQADLHAGMAHHKSDTHDGHEGHHSATGDCELGSQLNHPIALQALYIPVQHLVLHTTAPPAEWAFVPLAGIPSLHRARAPPLT
jgi:hypothetical protein